MLPGVYKPYSPELGLYEFLKEHELPCLNNRPELTEKIREYYFEIIEDQCNYYFSSDTNLPSIICSPTSSAIAERIYEWSVEIITSSYKEHGYSDRTVEEVLIQYDHEIGCELESEISQVLWELGYPEREKPNAYPAASIDFHAKADDYDQLTLLEGWC